MCLKNTTNHTQIFHIHIGKCLYDFNNASLSDFWQIDIANFSRSSIIFSFHCQRSNVVIGKIFGKFCRTVFRDEIALAKEWKFELLK